jgi:hypothetical protein
MQQVRDSPYAENTQREQIEAHIVPSKMLEAADVLGIRRGIKGGRRLVDHTAPLR